MNVKQIDILTGEKFDQAIDRLEKDLLHVRRIKQYRGVLDQLADICALGNWSSAFWPVVLKYRGEATTEEEARSDLAHIMRTLRVIFGDLQARGGNKAYGEYKGTGQLGPHKVEFILEVPWLPKNCVVTEETYSTPFRHISVFCDTQ